MARHPMGDWSPRAMDQTSACLPTTQHALPNAAVVVVVVLVAFDQPGYTLLFSSFFLFSSLLIRFFFSSSTRLFLDGAHASQPQVRSKMVNRAHDAICARCNASTKQWCAGKERRGHVEAIRAVPEMHNAYALMHACHDRFRGIVLSGSRSSRCREWKPTTHPRGDTRSNANILRYGMMIIISRE